MDALRAAREEAGRRFARTVSSDLEAWYRYARDLMHACERVWADYYDFALRYNEACDLAELEGDGSLLDILDLEPGWGLNLVSHMLGCYALENLAKGLLIQRKPALLTDAGLAREVTTHGVDRLLSMLEVHISDTDERELLVAARDLSTWQGRYPTNKDATATEVEPFLGYPDLAGDERKHAAIRRLYARLSTCAEDVREIWF